MKQTNWAYWIAGQAGVIPLALGMPGVAKTESTRALAKAAQRRFLPVMLDQILPEDLGGYPVVKELTHNGKQIEVMRRVFDEKFVRARLEPSVMLIDELTNAGHSTQAAALQVMAEGIEGCWIFAAANPPEQAAAGVELTPPMVNRLCILQWEIDREAIRHGWCNGLQFQPPEVPLLPDNWRDHTATWGPIVSAFIDRFPTLLDAYPKDPRKASQPFPSPRSWTNVIKLLSAAESVDADEGVKGLLVHGCVGMSAAVQFTTWMSQQGLPDPEAILSCPSNLQMPHRGDLGVAVLSAVIGRVAAQCTPERWENAREVLGNAFTQGAEEIAIAAHGRLWKLKPANYSPKPRNGVYSRMNQIIMGAMANA